MTVLVGVLFLSACACDRHPVTMVSIDSYVESIEKIKDNLEKDIRPGYKEALDAAVEAEAIIPALRDARLDVVDTTIVLCDDCLNGAVEKKREDGTFKPIEKSAEGGDQ